mgnify:CR=1 FL=1
MGVSSCTANHLRQPWQPYGTYEKYARNTSLVTYPPYYLVDLDPNWYTWQVYGNN